MQEKIIHNLFIQEVKRRLLEESVPRLKKCLGLMTEEEIWYRPNENTVSAGNLVLHLCGNVRQWVLSGLAGRPDTRKREEEFNETGPVPVEKLIENVDKLMKEVEEYLDKIQPSDLTRERNVQGFEETGLSILVHVVEHFSYHVGQITYMVKSQKNIDTQYYGNFDLNATG